MCGSSCRRRRYEGCGAWGCIRSWRVRNILGTRRRGRCCGERVWVGLRFRGVRRWCGTNELMTIYLTHIRGLVHFPVALSELSARLPDAMLRELDFNRKEVRP